MDREQNVAVVLLELVAKETPMLRHVAAIVAVVAVADDNVAIFLYRTEMLYLPIR